MSDETLNPYVSPGSISGEGSKPSTFTVIVFAVCLLLGFAMLVVQQIPIFGIGEEYDMPQLTKWFMNPFAAMAPLALLPFLWKAVRWESRWKRRAVSLAALILMLFWFSLFVLAMVMPGAAIRSGMGQ